MPVIEERIDDGRYPELIVNYNAMVGDVIRVPWIGTANVVAVNSTGVRLKNVGRLSYVELQMVGATFERCAGHSLEAQKEDLTKCQL
jgi:hypothetical protein